MELFLNISVLHIFADSEFAKINFSLDNSGRLNRFFALFVRNFFPLQKGGILKGLQKALSFFVVVS